MVICGSYILIPFFFVSAEGLRNKDHFPKKKTPLRLIGLRRVLTYQNSQIK